MRRTLRLRREALTEMSPAELRDVVGADPTDMCTGQTRISCLTYISCFPQDCVRTRDCV